MFHDIKLYLIIINSNKDNKINFVLISLLSASTVYILCLTLDPCCRDQGIINESHLDTEQIIIDSRIIYLYVASSVLV